MKILLVHNQYIHRGGEEAAFQNLEFLLQTHGHTVTRFEADSRTWASHSGWRLIVDALQSIYSIPAAKRLQAEIRRLKPDIVHVHNVFPVLSPSIYWAIKREGVPIVQTVHNYRFLCANGLFLTPQHRLCERCKGGFFASAVRFGCYSGSRLRTLPLSISLTLHRQLHTFEKCIDVFIAPSHFLKNKLIEGGFPKERIVVIPNAVPSVPVAGKKASSPFFLFVGRLSQEKGLWTLMRAFQHLPHLPLKIIGTGPLQSALLDFVRVQNLRHIEILGGLPHDEVLRWMSSAWALIVPSECYENLPQVVLEAWANGTPVLASRIGGLAEMVQQGQNGWTFAPNDEKDLSKCVQTLASLGLTEALQRQCRATTEKCYNVDSIYGQNMAIYERVLQKS